jgi:hypothetical protein
VNLGHVMLQKFAMVKIPNALQMHSSLMVSSAVVLLATVILRNTVLEHLPLAQPIFSSPVQPFAFPPSVFAPRIPSAQEIALRAHHRSSFLRVKNALTTMRAHPTINAPKENVRARPQTALPAKDSVTLELAFAPTLPFNTRTACLFAAMVS